MPIESVMLPNHFILCCPLLLLPLIFPSIRVFFQWVGSSHQVAKVLEPQLQQQSFQLDIQGWFPLGLTGLILQSKGLSRVFSRRRFKSINSSVLSLLYGPALTVGKTIALTIRTFVGKVLSLLSNTLSRFVIVFLPRSKHLLISWLQLPSTVILGPKKINSVTASTFCPSICCEVMTPDAMILVFWYWIFTLLFHLHQEGSLVPLHFLPLEWYLLDWGCW